MFFMVLCPQLPVSCVNQYHIAGTHSHVRRICSLLQVRSVNDLPGGQWSLLQCGDVEEYSACENGADVLNSQFFQSVRFAEF